MFKKLFFLIISATILVALYGCHAGGSSPMAPDNSAVTVSPLTRTVNANGKFDDITFPSGAVIKCPNDNTFKEGVEVTAAEQKVPVITDNSGTYSYIYVYNISAVLPAENSLSAEVAVNTIEKPLSVTLPNDSTAGTCYVGTRANESDSWHYSLVADGVNSNARFMRLSANPPKSCTFNLYKLNIQFRLFVFDNEEKKDEVQVDTLTLTPADDVEIKDGKYTGKLTVKLNVEGENLNGIKAEDLVAKIIYRSENQQGANIDFAANKTDSSDKAVTGGYEHSFEITNIKIDNSLGNTAELSFELNLDGISLEEFPTSFLVEFYSKGSDENTRPFEYTQTFGFETKEQQLEPEPEPQPEPQPMTNYEITYDLDGGQPTKDNPSNYTAETETFTLNNPTKTGYTFTGWTGTDLDNPKTEVIIAKGSTGNREYKANWQQNAPDEYTLTLVAGTGIASVDDEKAYRKDTSITLNCTVKDGYEFVNWTDSEGKAVTSPFTMPEKAVTLTANAKVITYNLTYTNVENCTFATANPENYTVETESFTLNNPTKDGYIFKGWSGTDLTGESNQEVTIAKGSTGTRSYTANFVENYNITYDLAEGSLPQGTTNPATYSVLSDEITLNNPTRTGYTFKGWSGTDLNGDSNESVTIAKGSTGARTYTANWKLNLTLSIAANENTIIENDLYDCNASFTITPTVETGVVITDTEKANILAALCVKDSKNTSLSNLAADWNNESKIVLTFDTATLTASISYSISFGEIDGVKLSCQPLSFKTFYFKGRGVEDNPYQVASATQLNLVRNYLSCHFEQTDTIDLDGYNWVPIGLNYSNRFTGTYNGNDNKIMNLTISSSERIDYAGLFGVVVGKIENLILDRFSVTGANNTALDCGSAGVIAGYLGGEIASCTVTDSSGNNQSVIRSAGEVGGICGGVNGGSISSCHVENCDIIVDGVGLTGSMYAGGICGFGCTISSCYISNTNIQAVNADCSIGGICAILPVGKILSSCYVVNSTVSADNSCSKAYVGGIVGLNHCPEYCNIISSCYVANSNVSANNSNLEAYVGGIGGYVDQNCNISSCYVANSTVSANNSNSYAYVGGIGGYVYQNSNISSCYVSLNSETISGPSDRFGTIAGFFNASNNAKVTDCFYNKTLSAGEKLVALVFGSGVTNCYDGVGDLSTFSGKIWSDGKAYTADDSVWKYYDFSSFPPTLNQNQE